MLCSDEKFHVCVQVKKLQILDSCREWSFKELLISVLKLMCSGLFGSSVFSLKRCTFVNMAFDCGCLPSPANIESTNLEKLEKKLKALIKKRDEDIHVLQYQVAELIADNKRQKSHLDSGLPLQPTAPPLVAFPQTPVPMQPASPMTPPHAFPAQALAKSQNSLNLCHRCGKQPDHWPDKKFQGDMSHYWPTTVFENDIDAWCRSISSRIALSDSSRMTASLMRLGWIPENVSTGWLTVLRSGHNAKHKWVGIGCKECGGCASLTIYGSMAPEAFHAWLQKSCGTPVEGVL